MEIKRRKRDVSRERTIALALVGVIECYENRLEDSQETRGEGLQSLDNAITDAKSILETHGYKGLESIASRVATIETAINAAVVDRNGKEIARLGAELNRAQRGLPPIAKAVPAVKKRKARTPGSGVDGDKSKDRPPDLMERTLNTSA